MSPSADRRWMGMALGMAKRHRGLTWPNPSVGCVLVKEGRLLARAVTAKAGRPHAETQALDSAGPAAQGATAYVTLEPCAHQGQTPPCALKLIEAGVARVVVGADDPDPRVAGRGFALLQEAGIGLDRACQNEAEEVHRGFLTRVRAGRPFVTLKLASSLDGKLATSTGESRWITGEAARRRVHLMRAQSDAVLIGRGTAQQDAPRLDVRDLGLAERTPLAIVASSTGDVPPGPLAEAAGTRPVWVAHGQPTLPDATAALGVRGLRIDRTEEGLDLTSLMMRLGEEGLTEILCEGGPTLAAGLLEAGLVDELVWMTAGLTLGADGLNGLGPLGYGALSKAPRFTLHHAQALGPDVLSVWRPATVEPSP